MKVLRTWEVRKFVRHKVELMLCNVSSTVAGPGVAVLECISAMWQVLCSTKWEPYSRALDTTGWKRCDADGVHPLLIAWKTSKVVACLSILHLRADCSIPWLFLFELT